ncbi:MAG TPA: hypothetical protein VF754_01920, partial [Pyrinomonadaceae bacterium]
WTVPELRDAVGHLFSSAGPSGADWQVLLYAAGRAMLWVVVLSSCLSMYEYFRAFYGQVISRARRRVGDEDETPPPAQAAAPTPTGHALH